MEQGEREMKNIVTFGGVTLVSIILYYCGLGWFKDGSFNMAGSIVNILFCVIWPLICEAIFKEEKK